MCSFTANTTTCLLTLFVQIIHFAKVINVSKQYCGFHNCKEKMKEILDTYTTFSLQTYILTEWAHTIINMAILEPLLW